MTDSTRQSLLFRLKTVDDGQAWEIFYQVYKPLIINFARQRGCNTAMSYDVLQETMISLMQAMASFEYRPGKAKFRTFLLRIVRNHIVDAYRRNRKYVDRPSTEGDSLADELLRSAHDGSHEEQEQRWEEEWEQIMLRIALERVQRKIRPATYDSFRMYVLEGMPVEKVTETLGINRNTLYQHRNRVIGLLRQELADCEVEFGDI